MSDGPHRSLPMSKAWKELARRADNKAFDAKEVCDALPAALGADWQDIPPDVKATVRELLDPTRPPQFAEVDKSRIERCRAATAGAPLGVALVGWAIDALNSGALNGSSLHEAVTNALLHTAFARTRQTEEHYYRKSTELRATEVRGRLDSAISQTDWSSVASRILTSDSASAVRLSPKQTGLDDGVSL